MKLALWRQLRDSAKHELALTRAELGYQRFGRELARGREEPTMVGLTSQLATEAQIHSPAYLAWRSALKLEPLSHRKYWEYAFLLQALEERGLLREGTRGLGFGVGKEPLVALLASRGCEVLATDLSAEDPSSQAWRGTDQHADQISDLNRSGICDPEIFSRKVRYRAVDMNHVPSDLEGFDFVWSSCALEHLGSLENGLAFIERSLATLRPGGVAVHTTELNLSSDQETAESGDTVIYRKRDIERLVSRLNGRGHEVAPVNYHPGSGRLDRHVDVPPYSRQTHVKLFLAGFVTTSLGLIVRRKS